jgi:Dihydrofolate reductase
MVSLKGKNGEIDWCIMDEEMGFNNFLNQIDTIFYGRKSYDLWGESTPDIEDVDLQKQMESIHTKKKYVFSRTQKGTDQKAVYINENILEEVEKIKSQSGKDIWLYGGSSLITTFMNLGLVDELRLSVHPVILGEGKPLFVNIKQRLNLNLVDTRRFSSGVVQLIYHLK